MLQRLLKLLRHEHLDYATFQSTLYHSFNLSEPLSALFERYDVHAGGSVSAQAFAGGLLGLRARADTSPALRCAVVEVRRALGAVGGVHAVRRLALELLQGGRAAGASGLLSVRAALAECSSALQHRAEGELGVLLREASRPHSPAASVRASELVDMLRPRLTARCRAALLGAWEACGGRQGHALPLAALARAPAASQHALGELTARDFAVLWGAPLSAAPATVAWEEWLDYGRDVLATCSSEEGLLKLLQAAFGLQEGGQWEPAQHQPRPGSPGEALRSLRQMSSTAAAAAAVAAASGGGRGSSSSSSSGGFRGATSTSLFGPVPSIRGWEPASSPPPRGRAPGPASEATGVPVCLAQPLLRPFEPRGWEVFAKGVMQPYHAPATAGAAFGGGGATLRPTGSTFLPQPVPPRPLPAGLGSVAELYKSQRSVPCVMGGYLQSGATRRL